MRYHTSPNTVSLLRLQNGRAVAVASRNGVPMASYPAWLNRGRIPTLPEVMRDAAWRNTCGAILGLSLQEQTQRNTLTRVFKEAQALRFA